MLVETPFTMMVYSTDVMLPLEIDTLTWPRDNFSEEGMYFFLNLLLTKFMQVTSSPHISLKRNFSVLNLIGISLKTQKK